MTEADWRTTDDPSLLLEFLQSGLSDRKLRLYCCACCYNVASMLGDSRSRRAVELAERYADGGASDAELLAAALDANEASYPRDRVSSGDRNARSAAHLATYSTHTRSAFIQPPSHARAARSGR